MALSEELRLAIKLTAQDSTRQAFQGLNQSLDGLKRAAVAAAATVGSALAFRDVIASTQKLGEEVDLLRDELGLSAQEASKWNVAARITGLTAQDLSTTFGALNRKLIEQLPLMAEGKDDFTKWGVAVKDAGGNLLSLEEVFENARRVINDLPPGLARSGAAMDLFGRGGKQLIDFLTIGQEEMRGFLRQAQEWGLILDDQGVDSIESFNRQMRFMDLQMDAVKLQIGMFLLPILVRLLDVMRRGAGIVKSFGEALRTPIGIIKEVIARFGKFIAQIKDEGFVIAVGDLAKDITTKVEEILGDVDSWWTVNGPKWADAALKLIGFFVSMFTGGVPRDVADWVTNIVFFFGSIPARIGQALLGLGGKIIEAFVDPLKQALYELTVEINRVILGFNKISPVKIPPLSGGSDQGGGGQGERGKDVDAERRNRLAPGATEREKQIWDEIIRGGGGGGAPLFEADSGGIAHGPANVRVGAGVTEAFIPLNRATGIGTTVNVYVSGNVTRSEDELAEIVAGRIVKAMRGSGQPAGSPMSRGSYF